LTSAAGGRRWPSARKFGLALAGMVLSVPLLVVNGWFGLGILAGLVFSILWWFDFFAELRASPPAGRAGRWLVLLAGLPQAMFGLACLLTGLAIAGWLLWNLFVRREAEFQFTSLGGVFLVFGLVAFGYAWVRSAFTSSDGPSETMFEAAWTLRRDDVGVSVDWPKGERQAMAWDAVELIMIETNDSGPWGADVWTVLEGGGKRLLWPQGATGEEGMLAEMQRRFPGFDDDAVIAAMGCTDNARFVCWCKASSG
jgi:hypothetical protein